MSIINSNRLNTAGSIPTASNLNAPYDNLASDLIDGSNTSKRWANRDYINEAGPDCNLLYHDFNNGSVPFVTSSTSHVIVDNGGDTREITINHTCKNDCIVRIAADGTIGIPQWEVRDFNGSNPQYNQYQLALGIQTGGGSKEVLYYGNYTFSPYANACDFGAPSATSGTINYRNFALSTIKYFPAGTIIEKVQLLVKVGNNANQITIGRNNLFTVIAEN